MYVESRVADKKKTVFFIIDPTKLLPNEAVLIWPPGFHAEYINTCIRSMTAENGLARPYLIKDFHLQSSADLARRTGCFIIFPYCIPDPVFLIVLSQDLTI